MEETENSNVADNNRNNDSTIESVDSGYLTLTPHSATPSVCRSRISAKRHHRIRAEPWQSEHVQRHRTRLNQLHNSHSENLEHCELSNRSSPAPLSKGTWRTAVPVTPASARLQLLSPPPSPAIISSAVPSSSFISFDPIEEDVEMKLVIMPQSTPQPAKSPTSKTPPICATFSPTSRKSSTNTCSAESKQLGKLAIDELTSVAEIKPKRLDFSHRAFSLLHRTRGIPDYTGRETVDILALLGERSNHWRIISKILSFLAPQDLCSVSMVSKVWRRICVEDSRANMRRLSHIILRQHAKENLKLSKKAKLDVDSPGGSKSGYVRKGCLLEVQNLRQGQAKQQHPPSSPPVSPSKVKFHSFIKASRTLAPWEHLLPCPRCSFACHVDSEKKVGTCSRQSCSMEFCTSCSSRPHTGPCKTPLLATPTKRNKRLVVGSKQSKRNLRRL